MTTDRNNIRQLAKRNPANPPTETDAQRKDRLSAAAAQARHNAARNKRAKESNQ